MKVLICAVAGCLLFTFVLGQNNPNITTEATPTTANTTTPTTTVNTTTPTTTVNTTTAGPTTANTTATTPTTTKPTTTTKPITTPKPDPDKNSYTFTNNNVTCINMTGAIAFKINYMTVGNKMTSRTVTIPPKGYTVSGSCNLTSSADFLSADEVSPQQMKIGFFKNTWDVTMTFAFKDNSYYVSNISLTYVYDKNLPNASKTGSETVMYSSNNFLKTTNNSYYMCNSNITVGLNSNVTMSTKDFKYKAFNTVKANPLNGSVAECSQDEESNSIVPIAVGAALAGLVVIVLIAYLIGRRRSKKAGYESV